MTISVDMSDIRKFEKDLSKFSKKALPQATKWVVNTAAFDTREKAQENIRNTMILRNTYTVRSIRVVRTTSMNIAQQESRVGSISEYMKKQEEGGTKTSKGGSHVHIPTSFSAGQGINSKPRMRLPRGQNKISKISLRKSLRKFVSKKQHNFVAIKMAVQTGSKYVYLDLKSSKGIFKVTGGKRKRQIKMVHDMSRQSVTTPMNPWLDPAVKKVEKKIPRMYLTALRFQMKRNRLFSK